MSLIVEGRTISFMVLIISFVLFYYYMSAGKRGAKISVRTLPAVLAIPEAIGRAAEMGRPVYYTTASGRLTSPDAGSQTLASISILSHITTEVIKAGADLDAFVPVAEALPLVEETMRNAYIAQGVPDEFDPTKIQYFNPYLTATLGYFQRERPAATMLFGAFQYPAIVIGEAGNIVGAMQIGGSAYRWVIPFLVATCDYTLIVEELYAASAFISNDPEQLGVLKGEDMLKLGFIAIIILGFLLGFLKNSLIINLLGM